MNKARILGLVLAGALALAVMLPQGASAQQSTGEKAKNYQANAVPLVTMKDWQASTETERYSFLIGFITMLELEKEWQGKTPPPFKESLVPSWIRGFSGKTLKNLHDGLDNYAASNPNELNRPVAEILWFTFVQPTMTEKLDRKKSK